MKKFGTPTGTGPGSASENVGFVRVGMPSEWRSRVFVGRARSGSGVLRRRPAESKTGWPSDGLPFFFAALVRLSRSGLCPSAAGRVGATSDAPLAGAVGLIASSGSPLDVVCPELTSMMLSSGSLRPGSLILSSGVSAPMSSVMVRLMLPSSVSSNVRGTAPAGDATVPRPTVMPPVMAKAMRSLRL